MYERGRGELETGTERRAARPSVSKRGKYSLFTGGARVASRELPVYKGKRQKKGIRRVSTKKEQYGVLALGREKKGEPFKKRGME